METGTVQPVGSRKTSRTRSRKPESDPVSPAAEAAVLSLGLDDPGVVKDEHAYWLTFKVAYAGYGIVTQVRKSDGFFGFRGKWELEKIEENGTQYYAVPDFDTLAEVKHWIDEDFPRTLVLKDVPLSRSVDLSYAGVYLSEKTNITEKEKIVLDAIGNQFAIRKSLGDVEPDQTGYYPRGYPGLPVALEERVAVYADGTRIRRTPLGQSTVADLVKPGDLVKSNYSDTPYMVIDVTEYRPLGVPEYSLFLIELDHPRTKDGKLKGHSCCGINGLVAHDGRILNGAEDSHDEVFKISREEAVAIFLSAGRDINAIPSWDLPKEDVPHQNNMDEAPAQLIFAF